MAPRADYAGDFDPGFDWGQLDRAALGRLGREFMLFAHLHDRSLMPLVGSRFGPEAMTALALDEWMGASPLCSRRNRSALAIPGDGIAAILKAFQLDIGFPHQYMDVHYELVDDSLGYFWLPFCGAFQDVNRISRGAAPAIVQLCHHMEDPTFDATVMAVNPRARCRPEHRPPLAADHSGPTCRWRVFLADGAEPREEGDIARRVRESRAARFQFASAPSAPSAPSERDAGLTDYAGAFRPDFELEQLAQPVLARQCREFSLQAHLLMRAAYASLREAHGGETALAMAREQWAAAAPVYVPRIQAALGIRGDDMTAVLKTLQVDPALPPEYLDLHVEVIDARHGRVWIGACDAIAPGEPEAWLALLADAEIPGFEATLCAANPRVRSRPLPAASRPDAAAVLAWEIWIDPDAPPRAESPMANAVRASNAAGFAFSR